MHELHSQNETFFTDSLDFNHNLVEDINENCKRKFTNDEENKTTSKKPSRFKRRKLMRKLKKEAKSAPFYSEQSHPTQLLNELYPNLEFTFEVDTSIMNRVRFICRVQIEYKSESLNELFTFEGDGLSKKEAKRKCCIVALMNLYSETYKPPADVIMSLQESTPTDEMNTQQQTQLDELSQIEKRIKKLCTKEAVQTKSPSQLLYEICKTIANTGEFVGENAKIPSKKYTFQFRNVINGPESTYGVVYGFGINKKEAKNDAAKQALKLFLNCDLDLIAIS